MKFSEDQLSQLLSAFWIQANLPDNLPSNIEAIANSFVLTLISACLKVKSRFNWRTLKYKYDSLLFFQNSNRIRLKGRIAVKVMF